jgi:N-acetylglucosamine kinase-like BadF-type ATPase
MTASAVPSRSTSPAAAESLLAVDAGGTKTAAWLVALNPAEAPGVIGRGRTSGGNPLSIGFDAATRAVTEAIAAARNDAKHPNDRVSRLILSIAGAANPEVAQRIMD